MQVFPSVNCTTAISIFLLILMPCFAASLCCLKKLMNKMSSNTLLGMYIREQRTIRIDLPKIDLNNRITLNDQMTGVVDEKAEADII